MKRFYTSLIFLSLLASTIFAQKSRVHLRMMQTSDIHSNFFPKSVDNIQGSNGGLSRVSSLVNERRETFGDNLILMDNGDILQGQPIAYYYNFIDSVSPHICAEVMNYMRFDIGNIGNHDIETGRGVMERWIEQCNFPVLGANIINTQTNEPLLLPYVMIERDGVRVAVLGLVTPAIPAWLHEGLWKGLRFDDMQETAQKWMDIIRTTENPDVVIGLFHAGQEHVRLFDEYNENASLTVAREVPGFDAVFFGHDHQIDSKTIVNKAGQSVILLNPGNDGKVVAELDMTFEMKNGKVVNKTLNPLITDATTYPVDADYMKHFDGQRAIVDGFVNKRIGYITDDISTRKAFFGPTTFLDLIHQVQLDITGADISLTAPLVMRTVIKKGDITINDLFNIYKYENMLYMMKLTGQEIKDLLEESYYLWTNQMKSPDDHLILLKEPTDENETPRLANFYFNFDSAFGICYTVDVTKPYREKIQITSMADGTPFDLNKTYKVAVNSYRGNGGGELLTRGAGISQGELKKRVMFATDHDLRYYLMKYVQKRDTITPPYDHQWRFIPEEWVEPAAERDFELLYKSQYKM